MDVFLAIVVSAYVGGPLLTLVHELGHAVAARVLTGGRVKIVVGREPASLHGRVGWLELRWRPALRPGDAFGGWFTISGPRCASRARTAAFVAAGPAASALSSILLAIATAQTGGFLSRLLEGCTVIALAGVLVTAVPWRYPRFFGFAAGWPSDGLRVVEALKGVSTPLTG
jgi:hypothetical protein